jgi:CubicO group peptidase (beta-lactamase class C family)
MLILFDVEANNDSSNSFTMKTIKFFAFLVLTLLTALQVYAQEDRMNRELNQMIINGMKDWQIPGLVAVVVKDGEVVFKKVYGVKNIITQEPVDENTLFNMGSTTKAVICIALGILVDQGKMDWSDRVQKHLPSFDLSDAYISKEARIQDLLTHNLGIRGADLLWTLDSVSTQETIARFRLAAKGYPVRGDFGYNNLMYAVAGEVISEVSGIHWTEFVEENILRPLDMTKTKTKASRLFEDDNYVTPYLNDIEDGIVNVNYNLSDQIGAAGMIWSCAGDIANYLKFLVNDGVYESDTLLKSSTFKYLFEPHSFVPDHTFYPTRVLTSPNWQTYGLGWFQHDYRGLKLDFHTGSIAGLVAIAGVLHEKNVAVYVFANMDHAELRHAILYKALDLYAFEDYDGRNWHEEIFDLYDKRRQNAIEANTKLKQTRHHNTTPSLDLEEYVGNYQQEMYGNVSVRVVENALEFIFNDFVSFRATHWHFDTFRSDKHNRYRTSIMINFNLDQSGKVEELEVFGETFKKF